ncbi:hypothetical protein [Yoonia sp. BS5-3]|uniref:Transferrin-binding protein B C-lobe/N-lobe beta barrel domain-containing protein n=1 Tax=Yoonia phaeophyticola TaxID=3137369 RepID=A0ABZ2VBL0_9RHOB
MNNLLRSATILGLCTAVSGCLDAGDESSSSRSTYAEQDALAEQLASEINLLSPTDPGSLPTTGSVVDYAGVVTITADSDSIVFLGDLALSADFVNSTVSGNLTDVNDSNGVGYTGTIPLTNGDIDRNADISETVTGDLIGDVSDGSGNTVAFDTSIAGDFYDDEAYIAGDVTGTLTINGDAFEIEDGDGAFAVSDGL